MPIYTRGIDVFRMMQVLSGLGKGFVLFEGICCIQHAIYFCTLDVCYMPQIACIAKSKV